MKTELSKFLEECGELEPGSPITIEEIRKAEEQLNLKFADDYIECMLNYGAMCACGVELITATNVSERLNVVYRTLDEKAQEYNVGIRDDMYLIEDMYIDGILCWQDASGAVYVSAPYVEPQKDCDSLLEFFQDSE